MPLVTLSDQYGFMSANEKVEEHARVFSETFDEVDALLKTKNQKVGDPVHEAKKLYLQAAKIALANPSQADAKDLLDKAGAAYQKAISEENKSFFRNVKDWTGRKFKGEEKVDNFERVKAQTEARFEELTKFEPTPKVSKDYFEQKVEERTKVRLETNVSQTADAHLKNGYAREDKRQMSSKSECTRLDKEIDTFSGTLKEPTNNNNNNNSM